MKSKNLQNRNLFKIGFIVVIIVLILYLIFNKFGLIKYYQLHSEINTIEKRIKDTNAQIKQYDKDIKSLKENNSKLEEVAREKFHMKKKNEKAFQFKDRKEK